MAAVPSTAVEPAPVPAEEASAQWSHVDGFFPFVMSSHNRCHKVVVGYPEPPWNWNTKCGWPFGISDDARPVHKLPACHKQICERCLRAEREAARTGTESKVLEVGVAAQCKR